jgi:LysR family transcriptional regulator, low CO2-responsive transcriptional regulator
MNRVHGKSGDRIIDDIHLLRVFVAAAENLSFTRAAEQMGLTQSAVSHAIARLETGLDCSLLDRQNRAVRLTVAGETLLTQARRIFEMIDDTEAAVRQIGRPEVGRLRIGASVTVCQFFLPDVLREFRECFPQFALSIIPCDGPEAQQRLADGSIDVGLLIQPEGQFKHHKAELFRDTMGIVTSPLHRWAQKGKADTRQVQDEQFVLYAKTSSTYGLVDRYFAKLKVPLRGPIELGSIEAIKELVKLGLGVSVLAPWVMRRELAEGSLVWIKLPGPSLDRRWFAATPSKELSLAEQTFIDLCRSAGRELSKE